MSEPVDTSAEAVERVSREDDARIESALRYDDSEYQLAFQDGYLRAMTVAERRWAKERAEQETLLAERNRQNAELSMYSAAIDACRDACRAIMGNDVLAFVDDDVARALLTVKARADAGDALLREAASVLRRSYDATEWPADGSSAQEQMAVLIDAHLAGEAMGAREGESHG